MGNIIDQFMWRWQHSFAASMRYAAGELFDRIGVQPKPSVFLVGIAWPGNGARHGACVEPEDGEWPQSLFADIPEALPARFAAHPMQQRYYSDASTMADKPENIRRLCVSEAVRDALSGYDGTHDLRSFISTARPLDDYYVVTVLQVPTATLVAYPAVPFEWQGEKSEDNLLLASINVLLDQAQMLLERPEPGRFSHDGKRSSVELASLAAQNFFRTPFINNELAYSDLFHEFNGLSKLMYEGAKGHGRLALVEANDPRLEYIVELTDPSPLRQARWARKLLEMSGGDVVIASDYRFIHGLARLTGDMSQTCFVDFHDQQQWEFRRGDEVLVRVAFGDPSLPQPPISPERFRDNFTRIFQGTAAADADHIYAMLTALLDMPRGSMLVIAEDAASEAARLAGQGTQIKAVSLSSDLLARGNRIDGTILADPAGVCHAIGVILDGAADEACTPARGARYNSAVRYVNGGQDKRRLAFVISEDRTLDILPLLRPRVSRSLLEARLQALEVATIENWFAPRNFVRDHRFYLSAEQCDRANAVITRLNKEALGAGQIVMHSALLVPDPECSEDHFEP